MEDTLNSGEENNMVWNGDRGLRIEWYKKNKSQNIKLHDVVMVNYEARVARGHHTYDEQGNIVFFNHEAKKTFKPGVRVADSSKSYAKVASTTAVSHRYDALSVDVTGAMLQDSPAARARVTPATAPGGGDVRGSAARA